VEIANAMAGHTDNYFLKMIQNLRKHEDVLLYDNILNTTVEDEKEVVDFLNEEYSLEALNHPYQSPEFNSHASLWAAKTVYISAQLILYRENKDADLSTLLPGFTSEVNTAAVLSADLCLRFLPDLIIQLKLIDSEDALIQVLEATLKQWHYSSVRYTQDIDLLDFAVVNSDPCLHQLYCNRIVQQRSMALAKHPVFYDSIRSQLGIYGSELWNEFSLSNHSS
jgi:hypothetical protein